MENKDLLAKKVLWEKHSYDKRFFYHYEGYSLILLRINNFPDEPLYTLINGLEILDFDDLPEGWVISEYRLS